MNSNSTSKVDKDEDNDDADSFKSVRFPPQHHLILQNELVDVDFEFFDIKEIDFHGIKSLLKQTFASDHLLVDLSALSELIIANAEVGCSVKIDDDESTDPYAVIAAVNVTKHKDIPCINQISSYILAKSKKNPVLHRKVESLLSRKVGDSGFDVAVLFNERLINMPPQLFPQMLKMMLEEVQWATEDGNAFKFDYYILISKVYNEVESLLDADGNEVPIEPPKSKKAKKSESMAFQYFQPEDEIFAKYAEGHVDFRFTHASAESDSKRAFQDFGIDASRRLLLIPASAMQSALKEITDYLK